MDFQVNEEKREAHAFTYKKAYDRGYSIPSIDFSEVDVWMLDKKEIENYNYYTITQAGYDELYETYYEAWFDGRAAWVKDNR